MSFKVIAVFLVKANTFLCNNLQSDFSRWVAPLGKYAHTKRTTREMERVQDQLTIPAHVARDLTAWWGVLVMLFFQFDHWRMIRCMKFAEHWWMNWPKESHLIIMNTINIAMRWVLLSHQSFLVGLLALNICMRDEFPNSEGGPLLVYCAIYKKFLVLQSKVAFVSLLTCHRTFVVTVVHIYILGNDLHAEFLFPCSY